MMCGRPAFSRLQRERTLEAFNGPGCISQYRVPGAHGFKDHPTLGRILECESIHQSQRLLKMSDCYLESIQIGCLLSSLDEISECAIPTFAQIKVISQIFNIWSQALRA